MNLSLKGGDIVKLDMLSHIKKYKLVFLMVIPVIFIFVLYFAPINFSWRVSRAQDLLDAAYQDPDHVYLAEDLSAYHVQEVINVVHRLGDQTGQDLQAQADNLYRKHRNWNMIKNIADIEGQDVQDLDPESLDLNPKLSLAYWEENGQLVVWGERDAFTDKIDDLYRALAKTMKKITSIDEVLAQIPADLPDNEDQLGQVLDQLIELEEAFQACDHIEECQVLAQDQSVILDRYLAEMQVKQDQVSYSKEILDRLYQHNVFFTLIKDTNLDHRPKVVLTFDDGPNEDFTPQVLDILDEYGVKGTFFVVGRNVDQVPHIAQEILERGHEIGNHSYSHPAFSTMTDDEVLWEINATQDIIENHTGYRPKYYRMPFGDGGKRIYELIEDLTSIMWNVDTYDWGLESAQEIYDYTLPLFKDEMLVLMHDTSQKSVDGFALLIKALVEQNYQFVGLEDIEYAERYREF